MNRKYLYVALFLFLVLGGWYLFARFYPAKNVYRDDAKGLEIRFPRSWDNFEGRDVVFNDASGIVSLTFSLPLKGQSEPEDVWFVNIWPIRKWNAFECDAEAEICYKGQEIGRNSTYAFEKGYMMTDLDEKCASDKDFYGREMKFCNQLSDLKTFLDNWKSDSIKTFK